MAFSSVLCTDICTEQLWCPHLSAKYFKLFQRSFLDFINYTSSKRLKLSAKEIAKRRPASKVVGIGPKPSKITSSSVSDFRGSGLWGQKFCGICNTEILHKYMVFQTFNPYNSSPKHKMKVAQHHSCCCDQGVDATNDSWHSTPKYHKTQQF